MYKITNVETLGQDYTVADSDGNIINVVQIIPYTEILDAALGEYNESFGSYSTYLERSIEVLEGFDCVDPTRVLWYATSDEEVVLTEIIQYAINSGYDRIILEHLDELE